MKRSQATETIRHWIHSGKLVRGVPLPSERSLADELGVSRPTLRRALEPLVQLGLLESYAGRGTFVADNQPGDDALRDDWKVLALLLPDIANRFFSEVTESIEYTALQRGYQILLCNSRHQPHLEEFHVRQIVAQRIKGVILAHDPNQEVSASMEFLRRAGVPTVLLFSSSPKEADCDSVVLDDRAGVEQALRYLLSLGHRRIAFCRPLPGPRPHPREMQFRDFMTRGEGLNGEIVLDVVGKTDEEIQAALRAALSGNAPTACLAGNDNVALMLTKNLAALNVAVPGSFSVVGFDNLRYVQHLPVPLTTIDQPKQEMGRRAAELLFERINVGSKLPFRHEVFTPHLVIRESCSVAPRTALPDGLAVEGARRMQGGL